MPVVLTGSDLAKQAGTYDHDDDYGLLFIVVLTAIASNLY